jgi:Flp pilus assembly protein TadG
MQGFMVRLHSHWKFRQSDHHPSRRLCAGQGLVEFTLTLPLLLLIVIGTLDLGRIFFAYMTITNASREGAFYATSNPPTNATNISNIQARARAEADGVIIVPGQMTVTSSCPSGSCAADTNNSNPVRVTVSYPFQLITTQILGGGTIAIQNYTDMVIFGQ